MAAFRERSHVDSSISAPNVCTPLAIIVVRFQNQTLTIRLNESRQVNGLVMIRDCACSHHPRPRNEIANRFAFDRRKCAGDRFVGKEIEDRAPLRHLRAKAVHDTDCPIPVGAYERVIQIESHEEFGYADASINQIYREIPAAQDSVAVFELVGSNEFCSCVLRRETCRPRARNQSIRRIGMAVEIQECQYSETSFRRIPCRP